MRPLPQTSHAILLTALALAMGCSGTCGSGGAGFVRDFDFLDRKPTEEPPVVVLPGPADGASGGMLGERGGPGKLELESARMHFLSVQRLGGTSTSSVIIRNSGGSPLVIEDVRLVEDDDTPEFRLTASAPTPGQELRAGRLISMTAAWTPTDNIPDTGRVAVSWRTGEERDEAVFELSTPTMDLDLIAQDFGPMPRSATGDSSSQIIEFHNPDDRPISIDGFEIAQSEFSFSFTSMSFPASPDALDTPSADSVSPPERVDAHASFFARITNAPVLGTLPTWRMVAEDDAAHETPRLVFFAGAEEPRPQSFPLPGANRGERCVVMDAGESTIRPGADDQAPLDFGRVSTQCVASRIVRVQNCSLTEPLSIDGLHVEGGASFEATHETDGRGRAPYSIEPLGSERYSVRFAPASVGEQSARLRLANAEEVLELRGEGSSDASSYAVYAQARVAGSSDAPVEASAREPLVVPHYATMELIASSERPTLDGITHRWRIVESPSHSTSSLDASGDGRASVFLDALGEYVFEVTSVDQRGVQSCAPARIHVQTEHREQALLELRWAAPGSDTGEDELTLWLPGRHRAVRDTYTSERMQAWYLDPLWAGRLELWVKVDSRDGAELLFPIVRLYDEVADEGFEWEPEVVAHTSFVKGSSSWRILRIERERGGRTQFIEIEAPAHDQEDDPYDPGKIDFKRNTGF